MYLSSIDAVVDVIGPSEFPWSRLTVTPQVTVAFDPEKPRSLRLASHGVGPALDVVETLTAASGVVLSRLQLPIFHDDEIEPFTSLDVDSAPVDPTTGELAEPRYLRLSARPDAPGPQYFEVTAPRPGARDAASTCEPNTNPTAFGFYEEVRTMARLRQLTRTAYAEPVQLEVRYSSLDGKTSSESLRGKLGDSDIFYVPLSGLHSKDPRCKAPSILVGDEDHYGIPRAEDVAKLFVADDKLAHPKGSDLIVAQLGVDLLTAEPGRRIAADHPLDGFLDPRTDRDVHHERRPAPLREALVRRIPAIGRSERSALGAV
jgi:hypothetical protein